jgi:hypothetical protein
VIVTRRRRRPFPWRRLILPVAAVGLAVFALSWAPSRNAILSVGSSGPLSPAMREAGSGFSTIAAPFHFAAQNELLTERNKQILGLQNQVHDLQSQAQAKDKQIAGLQSQLAQLQLRAATTRSVHTAAAPVPGAVASPGASSSGDLSANATPDMRRTAAYWANMEPSDAAKVVVRLPVGYSARIFSLMPPDAVGAILDALPAKYAAELTQENPGLRR